MWKMRLATAAGGKPRPEAPSAPFQPFIRRSDGARVTNSLSRRKTTGLPVFAGWRSSAMLALSSDDSCRRTKSGFMTLFTVQEQKNRSGELQPLPRRSYSSTGSIRGHINNTDELFSFRGGGRGRGEGGPLTSSDKRLTRGKLIKAGITSTGQPPLRFDHDIPSVFL